MPSKSNDKMEGVADFDPEDEIMNSDDFSGFDSGEDDDKEFGREYYEVVGKSNLRRPELVPLGA
jgi:hypothetical protein